MQPYEDMLNTKFNALDRDLGLQQDMVIAHRLMNRHGLDELVWNHISGRSYVDKSNFLITDGNQLFSELTERNVVLASSNKSDAAGATSSLWGTGGGASNATGGVIHAAVYQ